VYLTTNNNDGNCIFDICKKIIKKRKISSEEFAKQRWGNVQELPRLCYAISDVIVYVDTVALSRDISGTNEWRGECSLLILLLDTFKDFCFQTQKRMGNAWLPELIIVFNMADYSLANTSTEVLTTLWCQTHDKHGYPVTLYFHSLVLLLFTIFRPALPCSRIPLVSMLLSPFLPLHSFPLFNSPTF
jgi:hypothetical protein